VSAWRFFCRILTTSTLLHPPGATSSNSLGFIPMPFSASCVDMTIECLWLSVPTKRPLLTHSTWTLLPMLSPPCVYLDIDISAIDAVERQILEPEVSHFLETGLLGQ
jgi:hypothetical protein